MKFLRGLGVNDSPVSAGFSLELWSVDHSFVTVWLSKKIIYFHIVVNTFWTLKLLRSLFLCYICFCKDEQEFCNHAINLGILLNFFVGQLMLLWLNVLKLELCILNFTLCLYSMLWNNEIGDRLLWNTESLGLVGYTPMETKGQQGLNDSVLLNQDTSPDHGQEP